MAVGAIVLSAGGTGAIFTTTSPATFTTTPTTAPRAIWVTIVQNAGTVDTITAVSYGGVALTRIDWVVDTGGETGTCEHWFLGSGIPFPGTQTISITHTGLSTSKWPVAIGWEADGDTEMVVFGNRSENQANPQIPLDTGAIDAIRICSIFSGHDSTASVAIIAGMSTQTSTDFGTQVARVDRQTSNSSGSFTIGYTAASDDVAMVAGAVQEKQAQTLTGSLFTKAPTFFTGAIIAAQFLTGTLFSKAPTFPTGIVTATYNLTGSLFTKAPTFPQGTVTVGATTLNGVLFTKAPTFPQGAVTAGGVTVTGVLFTKAPTFPTGTVTAGTVTLTGILFQKAPTFPAGTIGQSGTIFGNLFVKAPTFFTGSFVQGGPSFWTPNPAAYVGVTRYGPSPWGAELSGQRFEKAPTFPAGVVS